MILFILQVLGLSRNLPELCLNPVFWAFQVISAFLMTVRTSLIRSFLLCNQCQPKLRSVEFRRIALPLPSRVEVKIDAQVSWNEVTRLSDISAFWCGLFA